MGDYTHQKKIFKLLKDHPGYDYHDISKSLNLDIEDVINACKELMKEGAIGEMGYVPSRQIYLCWDNEEEK